MDKVIAENYAAGQLNYVVPCFPLAEGIISHRIDHALFVKMVELFRSMLSPKETIKVETTYRYDDLILTVDNDGCQRCSMSPLQYMHNDFDHKLQYFRKHDIQLSTTRFKPALEYNHSRQALILQLDLGSNFSMIFEALLPDKKKRQILTEELTEILTNSNYAMSLSYYLQVKTKNINSCKEDLSQYILLLSELNKGKIES